MNCAGQPAKIALGLLNLTVPLDLRCRQRQAPVAEGTRAHPDAPASTQLPAGPCLVIVTDAPVGSTSAKSALSFALASVVVTVFKIPRLACDPDLER